MVNVKADRDRAILKARQLVSDRNLIVLDTETTGFRDDDEVCEIAAVDREGTTVVNSRVRPSRKIPIDAIRIHGITNKDVKNEPKVASFITYRLGKLLNSRTPLATYNAAFDLRLLDQSSTTNHAWRGRRNTHCIMELYADYWGAWSDYHRSFTFQSLDNAAEQCGLKWQGAAHSALGDARMALAVLRHMAESEVS